MRTLLVLVSMCLVLNASEYYYERGELVELKEISSTRESNNNNIRFYKKYSGQKVGITDQIILKCKENVDCMNLLSQFQQTNVSKITDTIYVVKVTNYDEIFSLSRDIYNSGEVEFAHPNFIRERKLR